MNLILKIVQGPNAGAEIALIEGMNVKLGKGDECDIVIADQTLPDVACEIEVGAERVMLLLPGGGQERLEPLHVKVFETTAIAVGPADGPWGTLVWPDEETEKKEEEPEEKAEEPAPAPPPQKFRKLQIALLVVLVLVVVLEFVLWLFWPFFNGQISRIRSFFSEKYKSWTVDKIELAAQPVQWKSLEVLAKAYGVETTASSENESEPPVLKGNLKTSAERLKLTAEAYSLKPGVVIDLSDDESLARASTELLSMVAGNALKVEKAENRELVISGTLKNVDELRRVLEALKSDVPHIDKIDCTKVDITPPAVAVAKTTPKKAEPQQSVNPSSSNENASENTVAPSVIQTGTIVVKTSEIPKVEEEDNAADEPPKTQLAKLPIVGVMTTPIPYLVLRNGSRVLEGAEFGGFVVSKISEDVILLKNGDQTIEWRP